MGRSPSLKPTKVTLFTLILFNLENSIRNIIRKTVFVLRLDYQILLISPPLTLRAGSALDLRLADIPRNLKISKTYRRN